MISSDLICLGAMPPQTEEDKYLLVHSAAGITDTEAFYAPDAVTALKYKADWEERYNDKAQLYVKVKE